MSKSNPIDKVVELVLELAADAYIERQQVAKDSPAFESLRGAIAAYGRVLARLTILQESQGFFTFASRSRGPEHVVMAEEVNYVA